MATESATNPNLPIILSDEQTEEYLRFLKFTEDDIEKIREPNLENLSVLMVRQLATAPFCNIDIHYSQAHQIVIDISYIFNKVIRRKRGGYCMELNTLFSHLLATLGYNTWLAPARVSRERTGNVDDRNFHGISHVVNLIEFDNGKIYLVDVAYGGPTIVQPMELFEGNTKDSIGAEKHRLIKATIPELRMKKPHWILQFKATMDDLWVDLYMFFEIEATLRDCEIWSNWTSSREGIFLKNIIAARVIREGNKPVGKYILFNSNIKRKFYAGVEDLPELTNEEERVKALKDFWGIELSQDDQEAIRGREPEIRIQSELR
ncbi:hypothetical protein H072_8036 [Dactylellina haptotyla CBS 200.50]|uniref:Uncharacterized protein n=1 Tax=Dactylellina haptotyla (strain CBS 200.50) TaxID=1284197 RepID=S8A5T9_DACHA|nr:hypothetical protein H072_8036 [Dactylellina haptotyla CBS 200.50]